MTKHLTKPIRAIHFLVLAFLMTLSSPVAAQDYNKGVAAAEAGDAEAQFNLGASYEFGMGVARDQNKAAKWYRLAAEQGHADAQYELGQRHLKGRGVLQNYKEAVKWYQLAAEQGVKYAHTSLGVMYANGQGVPQDNTLAHMWFNIGGANGHEPGGTNRDEIAKKMTSADISKAQAIARECMNSGYTKCGY